MKRTNTMQGGKRVQKRQRRRQTFREILEEEKKRNIARLENKAWVANQLAHRACRAWRGRQALFCIKQAAVEQAISVEPERYRVSQVRKTYIGVTNRRGFRIHIRRRCQRTRVRRWLAAELRRIGVTRTVHTEEAA